MNSNWLFHLTFYFVNLKIKHLAKFKASSFYYGSFEIDDPFLGFSKFF